MRSGRAGLSGRQSFLGAGGRAGLITGDAGIQCSRDFNLAAGPRPGLSPRLHARPALSVRLSSCCRLNWPSPVGRAVRACGGAVRAGWLARQAIVDCGAGGRAGLMPGNAGISGSWDFRPTAGPKLGHRPRPSRLPRLDFR